MVEQGKKKIVQLTLVCFIILLHYFYFPIHRSLILLKMVCSNFFASLHEVPEYVLHYAKPCLSITPHVQTRAMTQPYKKFTLANMHARTRTRIPLPGLCLGISDTVYTWTSDPLGWVFLIHMHLRTCKYACAMYVDELTCARTLELLQHVWRELGSCYVGPWLRKEV